MPSTSIPKHHALLPTDRPNPEQGLLNATQTGSLQDRGYQQVLCVRVLLVGPRVFPRKDVLAQDLGGHAEEPLDDLITGRQSLGRVQPE